MIEQDVLLQEDRGRVRLLTLNRPDRLNAFDDALLRSLLLALQRAVADEGVHVVVLTGAGRAFSSGADLGGMARSHEEGRDAPKPGKQLFEDIQILLEAFAKPLVAAVNGIGVGFGFTILGYCDFSFLGASARLRTPFSQLGLSPEASSSYLFPLRMGWRAANRALLIGEWFSAQDVVDCGLGQQVVPDAALLDTALAFAAGLAEAPLQSLVATKALMLGPHLPAIRAARAGEAQSLSALIGTPANREAVRAFAARRAAKG